MGGAAGGAVALGEALITAGGFGGQGRVGVVLGAAEGPLVVKGPHQGHGQVADLLNGERAITQPMQVHQIGLALAVAMLQFATEASRGTGSYHCSYGYPGDSAGLGV
jgi:hypothetical protein